jgi:cell wall-associated NlpC family hydrolase
MKRRFALALLAVLAGCGQQSQAPAERPAARVFTVPDELPPPARTPRRAAPEPARARAPAATAPSDAEVGRELADALGVADARAAVDQAGLTDGGMATVPPSAPGKVRAIITAANQVARAPYRYGGGHGGVGGDETWVDSAYDCSGSVSFALASAGLVDRQLASGGLMEWGEPGPGKWVTVYANAGHAFMVVAGLRYDTVERARTGTRWGAAPTRVSGFTARHPAGL